MPYRPRVSLATIISRLGLTGGLKLCVDAADAASYLSGQSWLDTSGNGYDFFRGAGSGAGADDPTFNGTPGGLSASEFWSFDGGDYFRYDSASETWMNNLHKTGAKYSAFAWIYPVTGANNMVFGTNGNTSNTAGSIGVHFGSNSTNVLVWRVANGSGVTALAGDSTLTVTNATWQAVGASGDAAVGAGGLAIMLNGAFQTVSSTITSPSASNASFTMEIAARGNANSPAPSGSRLAMLAVWEGVALSQAQLTSIYNATIAVSSMPVFHKTTRFFTRNY